MRGLGPFGGVPPWAASHVFLFRRHHRDGGRTASAAIRVAVALARTFSGAWASHGAAVRRERFQLFLHISAESLAAASPEMIVVYM